MKAFHFAQPSNELTYCEQFKPSEVQVIDPLLLDLSLPQHQVCKNCLKSFEAEQRNAKV